MTRTREPFVSGLSGAPLHPPPDLRTAQVMKLIGQMREQLADESARLEPWTRDRFDGSETHAADPEAIARRRTCEALLALIDVAAPDAAMRPRVVAEIARRLGL